jgi:hypothetical protein
VALGVLVLLSPAIFSYSTTMLRPSSLPVRVRTVEWIRDHHGNWLVDEVEHYYYGWKAPHPGGPQLSTLPTVGVPMPSLHKHLVVSTWPPPIKPVFSNPLPGEGVWHRTGPTIHRRPPVLVTTFRSERDYPTIVAYVAWFDHKLTSMAWYPGRYEPPNAPARGPAMVPFDQRSRLLATFNGGFTHNDGNQGSSVNGNTNEPLIDGLGTLIGYRDGRVALQTWTGGPNAGPNIYFARQSLPLIIQNGRLNPNLNDSTQWGFTVGNAIRVWRTGLGIDKHGNLIYAAADYQTVTTLAQILLGAGAVNAIQLDINAEWPTLIAYRFAGQLQPDKIVPNVGQPATRYLVPDDRDFFAVYARRPGPVSVPFG